MNSLESWRGTAEFRLNMFFTGLLFYVGGWLLAALVGQWWSILLGFFLMAVPALAEMRSGDSIIVGSGCFLILVNILKIVLCVIFTPIYVIKNLVTYFPAKKERDTWKELLDRVEYYLSTVA
ncbi:MAG: hypothetical protein IJF38_07780 [Clostridia bacterium]|nr:hypothetical protein [Clostridia bacterium]